MIKKILKWTAWISAFLALLLLIAYWTSPYWVPGQLAKFLPPPLKLEQLDLERPGLTRTKVKHLTLQIEGSTQLSLELSNTELHYSLWQQKLLSVSAQNAVITIIPAKQTTGDKGFQLPNSISLPGLPIKQLSIEQLQLKGIAAQDIGISNIQLSSDDKQLNLSSHLSWMGLEAELQTEVSHNQQLLTSLNLQVTQDSNQLTVKAQPQDQAGWQLNMAGQISKIPFVQLYSAELGVINFDLSGTIQQPADNQFQIGLAQGSTLEFPIDFNPAWFEQQVASYAKEYGLSLDTQQLSTQVNVALVAKRETLLEFDNTNHIFKANGQLDFSTNNDNVQLNATIDSFAFDLSKTLAAPEQLASSQFTLSLQLPKTQYQTADQTLTFTTNSAKTGANGTAQLANGKLIINSQHSTLNLDKSSLTGNNYSVNLPSHQWLASLNWTQDLNSTLEQTDTKQRLTAKFGKPVALDIKLKDEMIGTTGFMTEITFDKGSFHANYSASSIALSEQPLTLHQVRGTLKPDTANDAINGNLQFDQASYLTENIAVDYVSGDLDWKLLKRSFTAKGKLQHSQNTIPVRYVFSLKSGAHNLQIDRSSLPMLTLKSWTPFLKAYPALQVTGGDLNINKLSGNPLKLLFEGAVSVDKLSLLYDKLALNNATISDKLSNQSALQGAVTAKVDRIQLAAGIAIRDLSFRLDHTVTDYLFKDIKGQLLGGTISIPRLDIHNTQVEPFSLMLSNINLQTLLSALESEKLSVSGNFNIILPLIIRPGSRQIANGTFINKQPGVLSLKSDAGKEANIAFQALENFHYTELSGTIDYNSEGNYIITLYALGSNPNLYNGFPIKLDLTLRGNLPNLLYSMMVTGDMATPVLEDLKQKDLLKIQ